MGESVSHAYLEHGVLPALRSEQVSSKAGNAVSEREAIVSQQTCLGELKSDKIEIHLLCTILSLFFSLLTVLVSLFCENLLLGGFFSWQHWKHISNS